MGLDMYIFKRTAGEGHNVEIAQQLAEKVAFVEGHERLSRMMADNGKLLDIDQFWTINAETPEEKRERLMRDIQEELKNDQTEYVIAKSLLTPENIAIAESYSQNEVAYWRKANQIHAWFVKNVQDGEDDCGYYPLSQDKMRELMEVCQKVIEISKDNTLSVSEKEKQYETWLPSQEGFFFGSTAYDEYYLGDLENTIEQLMPLVEAELLPHEAYYYTSSW